MTEIAQFIPLFIIGGIIYLVVRAMRKKRSPNNPTASGGFAKSFKSDEDEK